MKYLQNKYLKLVVAALIVVWAVYQFVQGNIGNGIALILLSLFPVLLYFRNEFILLTFLRLRKQDFEGMEKWLSKIADPENCLNCANSRGITIICTELSTLARILPKQKSTSARRSN